MLIVTPFWGQVQKIGVFLVCLHVDMVAKGCAFSVILSLSPPRLFYSFEDVQ